MRRTGRHAGWPFLALLVVALPFLSARADEGADLVTVRVKGRGGRPLAGMIVLRRDVEGRWDVVGRTDESGSVVLPDAKTDGSWTIGAWIDQFTASNWKGPTPVEIRSKHTELDVECGAQLTVDIVDAESGAPIDGAQWLVSTHEREVVKWTAQGKSRWALLGFDFFRPQLQIRLDPMVDSDYWIGPEDGRAIPDYWAEDQLLDALAEGHAFERRIVVPVRRAAMLRVECRDSEQREVRPRKASWRLADGVGHPLVAADPVPKDRGEVILRAPFYRSGRLWAVAEREYVPPDDDVPEEYEKFLVGRTLVVLPYEVPLAPIPIQIELEPEIKPSGSIMDIGGGIEESNKRDPAGAKLEIRTLHRDGIAIAGCPVCIRSDWFVDAPSELLRGDPDRYRAWNSKSPSDTNGDLVVAALPSGGYTVSIEDDRFVATTAHVQLERGKSTRVELREPVGVTVAVSVVDVSGRPLPFAAVKVLGPAGGRGDAGVEPRRIDPFADKSGKRTFVRVDPGLIEVTARWGAWSSSTTVQAADGSSVAATVVFDPKKSK